MHPILFEIGGIEIRTYGVLVLLGFLAGVWFASNHLSKFGISKDRVWDVAIWAMIFGVVGARVFFVIQHWDYYSLNPTEIFAIWKGGMTFYGILFGVIPVLWFIHKEKWNFWATLDAAIPGITLGIAIGRWGCFFNGCCYGKPTSLPFGVIFPEGSEPYIEFGGVPVHPSQIYESVGDAILFLVYLILLRKFGVKKAGLVGSLALIFTPFVRFLVDFTRHYEPNAYPFGLPLTFNQWIAIVLMILGLVMFIRIYGTNKVSPSA
ncbi:MAG: prolipoprotein diacylglyceryl transferase [candidate division WOR-3 bacterium]